MHILIVGGAGYIGSHMVKYLMKLNHQVTVIDDLSNGFKDAVLTPNVVWADMADEAVIRKLFKSNQFDAVMHFASFIQVGESVTHPIKYYQNNFSKTMQLIKMMIECDVKRFIFSSTAAVYGNPVYTPIDEVHPKTPINPYGRSKLMVEEALADLRQSASLEYVSLRYFNAAGADPEGELGERHQPETHLIPLVLQVANGRLPCIKVFGDDYDTEDGTCVRDYIHVLDLAEAHIRAVEYLVKGGESRAFNLGNGNGFSVKEVINTAEEVTGKKIHIETVARRAGDPPILVADSQDAKNILGWRPQYSDLATIIKHAWAWERKFAW